MKNIDLNAGGLLGSLACGTAVIGFAIAFSDEDLADHHLSKLIVSAVIGGAFVGNFLWARLFQR